MYRNHTDLEHTTLSATLATEYAYLGKVYLGGGRPNSREDVLELVYNIDNFCADSRGRHCWRKGRWWGGGEKQRVSPL